MRALSTHPEQFVYVHRKYSRKRKKEGFTVKRKITQIS